MACAVEVPIYGYASTVAWDTSYTLTDEPLSGDFYFTFTGKQGALGAVVGVTPVTSEVFASYLDIQYGIHFRQNKFLVVENGVPKGAWVANDLKWEYTISRLGDTVYYTRRDTLVTPAVVFDDRAPGIPILGELLYVSTAPSYGEVLIDSSFYAVGDGACFLAWGSDSFVDPEYAALIEPGNSVLQEGLLPLTARAGGSATADAPITAMMVGTMGLDGSATGRAMQGVYGTNTGDGSGHLYLNGWGSDTEFTTYGGGYLTIGGGLNGRTAIGSVSVQQSNEARMVGYLGLTGSGYADEFYGGGVYAGQLPIEGAAAGRASLDPAIQAVADWQMGLDMIAIGSAQYTNYFQIVLPELSDSLAYSSYDVSEFMSISVQTDAHYAYLVQEFITLVSQPKVFSQQYLNIVEQALAVAEALPAFSLWVAEDFNVTAAIDAHLVSKIAEQVLAAGMVQTFQQALVAVISAVAVSDGVAPAYAVSAAEAITISDAAALRLVRLANLSEALSIADSVQYQLTIMVEVSESANSTDNLEFTSQLLAELLDEVVVYGLLKTGSDVAQTWVMNTEGGQPLSEYDNYEFSSLVQYQDEFFGTTDAGLYALTGDADAGTPITAEVASLQLDFGTSRMKRIRSAYLGYTATNELVLKVRSVSQGQMSENWYKATQTKTPGAPDGGYMPVGQGLKSRYWQFELTNIAGGDFEVDQIELHALFLNRRV